jgi:hypothetical protein
MRLFVCRGGGREAQRLTRQRVLQRIGQDKVRFEKAVDKFVDTCGNIAQFANEREIDGQPDAAIDPAWQHAVAAYGEIPYRLRDARDPARSIGA